ncbi:hypothetical protein [Klenkia marina]|uniref:hypothetical protein n=1 Tax=Klenkia marina TaxID=1960309 RepID=UPI001A9F17AE|nr:hypothetical protein [Klenkia marina]
MSRSTVGRLIGLAGLAGVAATGVVLARDERQRRAYTPDDVRARLHARAEAAEAAPAETEASLEVVPAPTTRRGRLAQRARGQLRHLPHWLQRSDPLPGPDGAGARRGGG